MKQSTISFLITPDEFKLLADVVYLEPFLDEILSKVKEEEGGLRLKFPYDDLEDAINALGHQKEHESAIEHRQKLRALIQKLEGYKRLRPHVHTHGKVIVKKPITVYIFDVQMVH